MVGGQVLDLSLSGGAGEISLESVRRTHR